MTTPTPLDKVLHMKNVILVSFSSSGKNYLPHNIDELHKLNDFMTERYEELERDGKEIGAILNRSRWVDQAKKSVLRTMSPKDDVSELTINGKKLFLANHQGYRAACKAANNS